MMTGNPEMDAILAALSPPIEPDPVDRLLLAVDRLEREAARLLILLDELVQLDMQIAALLKDNPQ